MEACCKSVFLVLFLFVWCVPGLSFTEYLAVIQPATGSAHSVV